MTFFALGFATMLLALQVYSFSQPDTKKIPIWKAIILSVGWPITISVFIATMVISGKSPKAIAKLAMTYLKKPIG